MAKTKRGMLEETLQISNNNQIYFLSETKYKDCEWYFQFDNEEPTLLAVTKTDYDGKDAKITFTLTNDANSNMVFKDNKGRTFKLFAKQK